MSVCPFTGQLSWDSPQWEPIVAPLAEIYMSPPSLCSRPRLCCQAYYLRPAVPRGSMLPSQEAKTETTLWGWGRPNREQGLNGFRSQP